MKFKSIIFISAISALSFITSGCRDDFATINTDPQTVAEGDVNYLLTEGIRQFEPQGYLLWFYNAPMMTKWSQLGASSGGYASNYHLPTATGDQGKMTYRVMKYIRDVENILSSKTAEEAATFQQHVAALNILCIYMGIFDTDMYGDMPYKDAVKARYSDPIILTPDYDSVEDLYSLWLTQLEENITTFTDTDITKNRNKLFSQQDIIYNGDAVKWAKLSNSLRLKIAARLLSENKAKALEIAQSVATSSAGILDGSGDDFLFNKGTTAISDNDKNYVYHFGDEALGRFLYPSATVTDFMLSNQDPRIRFFYKKNDYNSKVVQAFFDQGKDLPNFIAANVEYTVVNGKKQFSKWKGLGEPWVRYYGLPVILDANQNSAYDSYFKKTPFTLTSANGTEYTYEAPAQYNEEMVRGRVDYTIPVAPGDTPPTDTNDNPWYGMYMSTAEVNLYLAEFALLGANLPQSAEAYYNKGVRASVEEYNRLAALNKIPYYGTTYNYDPNEKVIDLQSGEIDTMMEKEGIKLTGTTAEKLEKIYIQQILHLTYLPSDQFNVVRRSGIPSRNSSLFKWIDFSEPKAADIPRRFEIATPSVTDLMHDKSVAAYKAQGFTTGTGISTSLLNTERVWQDKGAPNFGDGPK